ncbi:MAG TPA: SPOR domain-containing protein [Rhizomicrobium sp.]|jgi:cell division septation protein DedD|nr:SPOR domain-containing protein [Rhizomicrobium sp.]
MANYDRGVYEPSDEVRVFDGSEEEEGVEGSRLPLLIVLALLVLAMFGGVVWLAYTQGVARGRGETPVLTAAAGPERVAPPQGAGGNTVPYQGFKIYEQPAPPDDSADNAPPARKPAAAPAAPAPVMAQAPKPAPPPATAPVRPAPAAAAPKAPPVASPVASKTATASKPATAAAKPAAAAPPKSVAALIQQANSTPVAEAPAAKSAAMSAAKRAPAPAGGPATAAPRQLGAMTPTSAPVKAVAPVAAPAPAAAKPAASGGYVLQIGAYKSQADAETAWKVYKAKHVALLSGYSDDVQQADLGEKGTWYRLRISGFADKDMAASLCDRLKADGGVCIPGR